MKLSNSFSSSLLIAFILILSGYTFGQNESQKIISGVISLSGSPLANVNITVKGSTSGTKTDEKGLYRIQAQIGDIIQYSYVGLNTVEIIVEDVTEYLNIEMTEKINELDETIINARVKANSVSELEKKMNVDLKLPTGTINPAKSGFDIKYIAGRDLNQGASLASALGGKFAGTSLVGNTLMIRDRPASYILDGGESVSIETLNIADIEDVYIIKNRALVVIRTRFSPQVVKENNQNKLEQLQNQNYYTNDAVSEDEATIIKRNITNNDQNIKLNTVSGQITHQDIPVPQIQVTVDGSNKSTRTDDDGQYSIKAKPGDIIRFKHQAFKSVSILVEDVTSIIDIDMVLKTNKLDEILVTAKNKEGKESKRALKSDEIFTTSRGNFDPKRSGFSFSLVGGQEISTIYNTLGEALDGKLPGVRYDRVAQKLIVVPIRSMNTPQYPLWDIDGTLFDEEPPLDLSNIKEVRILKSVGAANKYGSQGAGGVVVVKTKIGDYSASKMASNKMLEQFKNKELYRNDAINTVGKLVHISRYKEILDNFNDKYEAYTYYIEDIYESENQASEHLAIASIFNHQIADIQLSKKVLDKASEKFSKNPEVLKAIAYQYQEMGLKREALNTYQNVFYLRPKYAQSYRDVANAFIENNQFKRGWRVYMNYLLEGKDIKGEGIGPIVYNEMEYLYFNRSKQTDIKESFVPKSENKKDFHNDIRLVFEWNTSEAEFELEFVNPQMRSYVFEHTLEANSNLIFDEKSKGYSSKEFMINTIGGGQWLVNLTYLGNKKYDPTYLKVTTYYNWGKYNQRQETKLYVLTLEDTKMQLMKINEKDLVVSN